MTLPSHTTAPPQTAALLASRGLEYSETACFAGLLLSPFPHRAAQHLAGAEGDAVRSAIRRVDRNIAPLIGKMILLRLRSSRHSSLSLPHHTWIDRTRRMERASFADALSPLSPSLSPSDRWIRDETSRRYGLFDPRHLFEWKLGLHLEPATLRLVPAHELQTLVRHLGLAASATVLLSGEHGRDNLKKMIRKLGLRHGRLMVAAVKEAPAFPKTALRAVAVSQKRRDHLLEKIDETGLCSLACAASSRGAGQLNGIIRALPFPSSESLLSFKQILPNHKELCAPLMPWVLETLQHLSRKEIIKTPYHNRRIVLFPPKTPISLNTSTTTEAR